MQAAKPWQDSSTEYEAEPILFLLACGKARLWLQMSNSNRIPGFLFNVASI